VVMTEAVGVNNNADGSVALSEEALVQKEFGLPIEDLYKLAIKFYRDAENSGELQVSYEERLKFLALSKQVHHGPFDDSQNDAGWFDFVGNDRTKTWRELGDLPREQAMTSFVFLLDRVCPPFKQFVHDHVAALPKPEREERIALASVSGGTGEMEQRGVQPMPIDWHLVESQRKQIQDALNSQTFHQFRAYAQQQLPGQPEQQEALIRQLQEQHYQQYMAQVYAQQQMEHAAGEGKEVKKVMDPEEERKKEDDSDVSDEEPGDDLPLSSVHAQMGLFCHSNPAIAPASLWNRQDIQQFKANIKKEGSEGIIKVGHGETVTVRVPTHHEGSCIFWEFATDHYDIGFGVLFEWTVSETNQVSIHVSESDDEEDLEEEGEAAEGERPPVMGPPVGDVEGGNPMKEKRRDPNKPHQDEIIPIYRRESHEEVYAGSHVYPGQGVYLLKFDNSYSLWRSKTLYYRVYYSK
ncbi:hypothetical protein PMAYCL1PPCAC_29180, partial [Pristionchus mayeri]